MVATRVLTLAPPIKPGVEVDVRTRYLRTWAPGFVVVSVDGDHVRLRRRFDGAALPVTIPVADVRAST